MQNVHVYSPGWAGAETLLEVITLNGGTAIYHLAWADSESMRDEERFLVVARDPITAILRAYSQEGYDCEISPAIFGQRLVRYCKDATYNIGKINGLDDAISSRTLYTEDHTHARHWAQSLGMKNYPSTTTPTITVANADELRTLCERDLHTTIADYKSVI